MKRIITSLAAATLLAASIPASAASYYGYIRNWGPEPNGNVVFDFLNTTAANATVGNYVIGQCGSGAYRLKASNTNYDVTLLSLLLAQKNSYYVLINTTSCDAPNINIIDSVKICPWTGNC